MRLARLNNLLLALSGLSDALITRSAFGPKADMPNEHVECPLISQSVALLLLLVPVVVVST